MSGLFGVVSTSDCCETLFYGTDYHSHLGTEVGGLAVLGDHFQHRIHSITNYQFKSRFADEIKRMAGASGIGVISDSNTQPFLVSSRVGDFALVTAGLITNIDEVADRLRREGHSFAEFAFGQINPTELVAKIIATGASIVDGVERVFQSISGSVSMLLLTRDGVYAARDSMGRTPLVIGEGGGAWAVASEACAFPNLGFKVVKFLGPGEIVLLTPGGLRSRRPPGKECQICSFLWIYTGYPASSYEGVSVEAVRERTGAMLARKNNISADLVAGIPDSGTGHAIGYAMESRLPFRRPLVKYSPGYGRSYTPVSQEVRNLVAKMKLVPIRDIIDGKRIVLCEDSIVRATQLKNLTIQKLWDNGAAEVHMRAACPPLMFPCKYALSTRSVKELAARRAIRDIEGSDTEEVSAYADSSTPEYANMVEWIRKDLNVTTLDYLTIDEMVQAIGLPRERLCTHCWLGD